MTTPMPRYVRAIIAKLKSAGYDAYAVGGCVRDTLLGRRPNDWDIATAAPAEVTSSLFRRTVPTGERYGTVTVFCCGGKCEVTTFRREENYVNSRRPEKIEFISDISDDLSRRDFTVNAMAMTADGEIIDLFGGRDDMAKGLIRCVGNARERFTEDALRMFRALRFSAQLGFEIERETDDAISACAPLAADLSAERVREETEKMLRSPRPEIIAAAIEKGLCDAYIKKRDYVNLSDISRLPKKALYRWAALAVILKNAGVISDAGAFLRAMRLDGKTLRLASAAADAAAEFDISACAVFAGEHGTDALLCTAAAAEALGTKSAYTAARRALRRGYASLRDLAVNGDDLKLLGITGAQIGSTLSHLLRLVNSGEAENTRDELLKRI